MRQYYLPESIASWQNTLLQSGTDIPVYSGQPHQRGQGIGSFFWGLFRAVWPIVRKVGVTVGKEHGREALRIDSELAKACLTGEVADVKTSGKQALETPEHPWHQTPRRGRPWRSQAQELHKRHSGEASEKGQMAKFVDSSSIIGFKSELRLFGLPHTDVSLRKGHWAEYYCQNLLQTLLRIGSSFSGTSICLTSTKLHLHKAQDSKARW